MEDTSITPIEAEPQTKKRRRRRKRKLDARPYNKGPVLATHLVSKEERIFPNKKAASLALNIATPLICRVLNPKSKVRTSKGWTFKQLDHLHDVAVELHLENVTKVLKESE